MTTSQPLLPCEHSVLLVRLLVVLLMSWLTRRELLGMTRYRQRAVTFRICGLLTQLILSLFCITRTGLRPFVSVEPVRISTRRLAAALRQRQELPASH